MKVLTFRVNLAWISKGSLRSSTDALEDTGIILKSIVGSIKTAHGCGSQFHELVHCSFWRMDGVTFLGCPHFKRCAAASNCSLCSAWCNDSEVYGIHNPRRNSHFQPRSSAASPRRHQGRCPIPWWGIKIQALSSPHPSFLLRYQQNGSKKKVEGASHFN